MGGFKRIGVVLAVLGLIAVLAGCGSGGSSSSAEPPGGVGSASFIVPGEENTIPTFGHEAGEEEREAVSAVLEKNLQARAAHNWAGQCASLGGAAKEGMEKRAEGEGKGTTCAHSLGRLGELAPKGILVNSMAGPIAALRVEGKEAYALYHGKQGKDYSMEMVKEGGKWKVASLEPSELPQAKPGGVTGKSEGSPVKSTAQGGEKGN
jgi:hypothetical protein